jgi:hypothetical protein
VKCGVKHFGLAFGVVALLVLVLGGARIVMQRNQRLSCTLFAAMIRHTVA